VGLTIEQDTTGLTNGFMHIINSRDQSSTNMHRNCIHTANKSTTPSGTVTLETQALPLLQSDPATLQEPGQPPHALPITPATSGTLTVTATYQADTTHGTSHGATTVTVKVRLTSTVISCTLTSIMVEQTTICTATVTDTSQVGTRSSRQAKSYGFQEDHAQCRAPEHPPLAT